VGRAVHGESDEVVDAQFCADGVDHSGDLIGDVTGCDRHDVRGQDEVLRVLERDDVLGLELRVGRVDVGDLDLPGDQRIEGRVAGRGEREVEAVDVLGAGRPVR